MLPEVRTRLLQTNPWLADPASWADEVVRRRPAHWVPRDLALAPRPDRVELIVGPRQAGKSSLVWDTLRDRPPGTVLLLNAEDTVLQSWARDAGPVVADLVAGFPEVRTVFVEEAQNLVDAGLFLKGLVDAKRGWEVVATGSSSYHLAARTRESLAGRATRHQVLPLSVAELRAAAPCVAPAVAVDRDHGLVERQLRYGGYPAVWFAPDPSAELADLLEAFVLRDASDRFAIERPDAFRRLVQLAAGQIGQMVNLTEWAALTGISANTVREYLSLLEESWILRQLPPFAGGKRREITGAARVHFYDLGLRNAALLAFQEPVLRPDRGALAEGWVFGELAKIAPPATTLHYWRAKGGAEMDFVLVRGDGVVGVEVKAGRSTVSRSVRSFCEAYAPRAIILVGADDGAVLPAAIGSTRLIPSTFAGLAEAVQEAFAA